MSRLHTSRSPASGGNVEIDSTSLFHRPQFEAKAQVDAVPIAVAVVNGMDYLLTRNCTHIANAAIRGKIEHTCRDLGVQPPIICTPEELMEE